MGVPRLEAAHGRTASTASVALQRHAGRVEAGFALLRASEAMTVLPMHASLDILFQTSRSSFSKSHLPRVFLATLHLGGPSGWFC